MGDEQLGKGRDEWSDLEDQARGREASPELQAVFDEYRGEGDPVDPDDYENDPERYWQDAGTPPAADAQPEE